VTCWFQIRYVNGFAALWQAEHGHIVLASGLDEALPQRTQGLATSPRAGSGVLGGWPKETAGLKTTLLFSQWIHKRELKGLGD
jgi:hypothetical protein